MPTLRTNTNHKSNRVHATPITTFRSIIPDTSEKSSVSKGNSQHKFVNVNAELIDSSTPDNNQESSLNQLNTTTTSKLQNSSDNQSTSEGTRLYNVSSSTIPVNPIIKPTIINNCIDASINPSDFETVDPNSIKIQTSQVLYGNRDQIENSSLESSQGPRKPTSASKGKSSSQQEISGKVVKRDIRKLGNSNQRCKYTRKKSEQGTDTSLSNDSNNYNGVNSLSNNDHLASNSSPAGIGSEEQIPFNVRLNQYRQPQQPRYYAVSAATPCAPLVKQVLDTCLDRSRTPLLSEGLVDAAQLTGNDLRLTSRSRCQATVATAKEAACNLGPSLEQLVTTDDFSGDNREHIRLVQCLQSFRQGENYGNTVNETKIQTSFEEVGLYLFSLYLPYYDRYIYIMRYHLIYY